MALFWPFRQIVEYVKERWRAEFYAPDGWDTPEGLAELRAWARLKTGAYPAVGRAKVPYKPRHAKPDDDDDDPLTGAPLT